MAIDPTKVVWDTPKTDRSKIVWDDAKPKTATTKDKILSSVPVRFAAGLADPVVGANALYNKVVGGAGQFVASGAGYFPNPVSDWFGQAKNSGQILANQETQAINDARVANGAEPGSIDWARMGGNVASPANYALAPARGAGLGQKLASGLAIGATQPINTIGDENPTGENYTLGVALNSGLGAATSGLLHSLGSNAKTPEDLRRAAQVKLLQKHGIQPSIGQQVGGSVAANEERLGSVPILGHFTHAANTTRPTEDLNRSLYKSVLSRIGDKVPPGTAIGRPSLEYMNDAVSNSYDDVLNIMSVNPGKAIGGTSANSPADPVIASIVNDADTLGDSQAGRLRAWAGKFQKAADPKTGVISGQELKGISSDIRKEAVGLSSDTSYDNRQLGQKLFELHTAIMDMAKAQNPKAAKVLADTDAAYTELFRINKAASKVGATDGVFSPSQFNSAVLTSVGKRNAAKASGTIPMQELGDAANVVLGQKTRNSGTPERTLLAALLAGVATNPAVALQALPAVPLMAAAYSPTGQRIIGKALTGPTLADALRKYAPKQANTIINAAGSSGPYVTRGATTMFNQ
tara:strand:- start:1469 stop:3199 length:1731 start_codon:yes stop_codon:yes gene_type:complete